MAAGQTKQRLSTRIYKAVANFFNKNKGATPAKSSQKRTKKKSKIANLISLAWDSFKTPTSTIREEFTFAPQQPAKSLAQIPSPEPEHTAHIPALAPTTTNDEFWAHVESFIKEQRSVHTRRAYEKDLLDFLLHLKTTKEPMNVHTVVRYRAKLETDASPRTGKPLSRVSINRRMATIKSFLNWLVLNGVLLNNPARAVKAFRAGRESPTRDIPDDLVRRMIDTPDHHYKSGLMHRAILLVLFRLGLRRSELTALRTSDIFEESGMTVLRVRGKGDKERLLPLPKDVYGAIIRYAAEIKKDLNTDQFLFSPNKNNSTNKSTDKELNPNTIAYVVKRYAKLAGVPYRVSPHSARATAVSNALDNKAPHRAVQYMAGWSTPLMVTRYDKRKASLRNSAVGYVNYGSEHNTDEHKETPSQHNQAETTHWN